MEDPHYSDGSNFPVSLSSVVRESETHFPGAPPELARILAVLSLNPLAGSFLRSVEELYPEIADVYLQVVRRPIDLAKVVRRATSGGYSQDAAGHRRFRRNVRRVFHNAEAFNAGDPLIVNLAQHLRAYFQGLWLTWAAPTAFGMPVHLSSSSSSPKELAVVGIEALQQVASMGGAVAVQEAEAKAETKVVQATASQGSVSTQQAAARLQRARLLRGVGLPPSDLATCVAIVDDVTQAYSSYGQEEGVDGGGGGGGGNGTHQQAVVEALADTRVLLLAAAEEATKRSQDEARRRLLGLPPTCLYFDEAQNSAAAALADDCERSKEFAVAQAAAQTAGNEAAVQATTGPSINGGVAAPAPPLMTDAVTGGAPPLLLPAPATTTAAAAAAAATPFAEQQLSASAAEKPAALSPEQVAQAAAAAPPLPSKIEVGWFRERCERALQAGGAASGSNTSISSTSSTSSAVGHVGSVGGSGSVGSGSAGSGSGSGGSGAVSGLLAKRLDDLEASLAERLCRGCSVSSVWATSLARCPFWATPMSSRAKGADARWPALVLATLPAKATPASSTSASSAARSAESMSTAASSSSVSSSSSPLLLVPSLGPDSVPTATGTPAAASPQVPTAAPAPTTAAPAPAPAAASKGEPSDPHGFFRHPDHTNTVLLGGLNVKRIPPLIQEQLKVRSRKPGKDPLALVEFLGTHEFAWVKLNLLSPFTGGAKEGDNNTASSSSSTSLSSSSSAGASSSSVVAGTGGAAAVAAAGAGGGGSSKAKTKVQAVREGCEMLDEGAGLLRRPDLTALEPLERDWWWSKNKKPSTEQVDGSDDKSGQSVDTAMDGQSVEKGDNNNDGVGDAIDSESDEEEDDERSAENVVHPAAFVAYEVESLQQQQSLSTDSSSSASDLKQLAAPHPSSSSSGGSGGGRGGGGKEGGGGGGGGGGAMVSRRSQPFPGELQRMLDHVETEWATAQAQWEQERQEHQQHLQQHLIYGQRCRLAQQQMQLNHLSTTGGDSQQPSPAAAAMAMLLANPVKEPPALRPSPQLPCVGWTRDGAAVCVRDLSLLEATLLPRFFKRLKKFNSMKFQMGAYGFKRSSVPSPKSGEAVVGEEPAGSVLFHHPGFTREGGSEANVAALVSGAEETERALEAKPYIQQQQEQQHVSSSSSVPPAPPPSWHSSHGQHSGGGGDLQLQLPLPSWAAASATTSATARATSEAAAAAEAAALASLKPLSRDRAREVVAQAVARHASLSPSEAAQGARGRRRAALGRTERLLEGLRQREGLPPLDTPPRDCIDMVVEALAERQVAVDAAQAAQAAHAAHAAHAEMTAAAAAGSLATGPTTMGSQARVGKGHGGRSMSPNTRVEKFGKRPAGSGGGGAKQSRSGGGGPKKAADSKKSGLSAPSSFIYYDDDDEEEGEGGSGSRYRRVEEEEELSSDDDGEGLDIWSDHIPSLMMETEANVAALRTMLLSPPPVVAAAAAASPSLPSVSADARAVIAAATPSSHRNHDDHSEVEQQQAKKAKVEFQVVDPKTGAAVAVDGPAEEGSISLSKAATEAKGAATEEADNLFRVDGGEGGGGGGSGARGPVSSEERKLTLRLWLARLRSECEVLQTRMLTEKRYVPYSNNRQQQQQQQQQQQARSRSGGGTKRSAPGTAPAMIAAAAAGGDGGGGGVRKKRAYGKSEYRGVNQSDTGKWHARVTVAGKKLNLGAFLDEESAARAYDDAAEANFGPKARFNFKRPSPAAAADDAASASAASAAASSTGVAVAVVAAAAASEVAPEGNAGVFVASSPSAANEDDDDGDGNANLDADEDEANVDTSVGADANDDVDKDIGEDVGDDNDGGVQVDGPTTTTVSEGGGNQADMLDDDDAGGEEERTDDRSQRGHAFDDDDENEDEDEDEDEDDGNGSRGVQGGEEDAEEDDEGYDENNEEGKEEIERREETDGDDAEDEGDIERETSDRED